MKIGKQFNTLTFKQYVFYIDNHKSCTDWNTLGLYRSIVENTNLTLEEKIAVRDYAHQTFKKAFDFLQLKDPRTFIDVSYLGEELTKADERKVWDEIRIQQQKILADKRIKHRNFGEYSKHNCGYETCPLNGIMIRQGSQMAYMNMYFEHDQNHRRPKHRLEQWRLEAKNEKQMIREALEEE